MQIKQIDVHRLQIPLRMPIRHNLADHRSTDNLIIRVTTDRGVTGFGEGVPRDFVTGETLEESLHLIKERLVPLVADLQATNPDSLKAFLTDAVGADIRAKGPAGCCALELALLDAAGKSWGIGLADFLGPPEGELVYSAILPMLGRDGFEKLLYRVREIGMLFAKIKVGGGRDMECLSTARRILGDAVDLRVDANGAWTAEEAVSSIQKMIPYGISAVEQPVAKGDVEGMRQVLESIPVPVVADESLCTQEDAESLVDLGPRLIFNLRLSKCGGVLAADRLYRYGRRHGIASQLGCQVGETGILAAAGRHVALVRKFVYLEGSYAGHLLKEDVVNEPVGFGPGGLARPLPGFGLGVSVNPEALARLTVSHYSHRL